MARDYADHLEQQKQKSTLQLLFRAARLLNECALERARGTAGLAALRNAHMSLMPHIDLEGTRLVDLADRVGITKQAVGQLVDDLEAFGVCGRIPDPSDGRAKLIRFTPKGRRQILKGLDLLIDLEKELAEELGPRTLSELNRTLGRVLRSELLKQ